MAVVENASLPEERVFHTTLAQLPHLADMQFEGPTVLLIGPQFGQRANEILRLGLRFHSTLNRQLTFRYRPASINGENLAGDKPGFIG